jgi:hypothetical protein
VYGVVEWRSEIGLGLNGDDDYDYEGEKVITGWS